eukprot:CAMPEP_0116010902 /NCGR_PEP_ID=MMETSP0321-20121206/4261_1 /TAXON_ID=163516 /ORGANISM="Leptocylindrus danicus var. danicus, Strain B650" /LENGTH=394 /DNA_ID=CAMNT_0003480057 /DNA_START=79 /DNA_END=1263 /DNA_ORIENTATION=-
MPMRKLFQILKPEHEAIIDLPASKSSYGVTQTLTISNNKRKRNDIDDEDAFAGSDNLLTKRLRSYSVITAGRILELLSNGFARRQLDLPSDVLRLIFLYFDMSDVPNVASVCQQWSHVLMCVEQELFFSLLHKFHPDVIKITKRVFPDAGMHNLMSRSVCNANLQKSNDMIPSPSTNWRSQFKRSVLLRQREKQIPEKIEDLIRPLSAYIFRVQLKIYATFNFFDPGEVLCFLVEDQDVSLEENVITFELRDKLRNRKAVLMGIDIHIIERSTGKQALLYHGHPDEEEGEYVCYELFSPRPRRIGSYESYAIFKSYRCECACERAFAPSERHFFLPSFCGYDVRENNCRCCDCSPKWNCFDSKYFIALNAFHEGRVDFTEYDMLAFLEYGLVYR